MTVDAGVSYRITDQIVASIGGPFGCNGAFFYARLKLVRQKR